MSTTLLSPLLWSFVPSQLTHILLPYLVSTFPGLFLPSPRGSPTYAYNYRIVYTLVVTAYLVYSFVGQGGGGQDWYALLQVARTADDEVIKKAFRSLSRKYHPDRAGDQHEGVFILIRQAYEGLLDPVKRYAYDRFGPNMVGWKHCKTVREHIHTGIIHSAGFYIFSGGLMALLSLFRKAPQGAYWRHTLFALLFFLELSLIISPTSFDSSLAFLPLPLRRILPLGESPQFVYIRTFHRLWASLSVGISQLAGVWSDSIEGSDNDMMVMVGNMVKALEAEAVGELQADLVPILSRAPNPIMAEAALLQEMEQVLVDRSMASHPNLSSQWKAALNKHRQTPSTRHHAPTVLVSELDLARRIPLPPSPPSSPVRRTRLLR